MPRHMLCFCCLSFAFIPCYPSSASIAQTELRTSTASFRDIALNPTKVDLHTSVEATSEFECASRCFQMGKEVCNVYQRNGTECQLGLANGKCLYEPEGEHFRMYSDLAQSKNAYWSTLYEQF